MMLENLYEIYKSYTLDELVDFFNNSKDEYEREFYSRLIEFHIVNGIK